MENKKNLTVFAEELSDAYSTGRYRGGWSACIRMLRARKYDDRQVEAIIRSKWTRWAADGSKNPQYGYATSMDLARFLDSMNNLQAEVVKLTRKTFA